MKIPKELAAILTILLVITGAFGFLTWNDRYQECIRTSTDPVECLRLLPPVQKAGQIAEACEGGLDWNCSEELAKTVAENKIEKTIKDSLEE